MTGWCLIGQRISGEGKAENGDKPGFRKAVQLHKICHGEAGKVAALIDAGKFSELEHALAAGTSHAKTSNGVGMAWMVRMKTTRSWQREACACHRAPAGREDDRSKARTSYRVIGHLPGALE